MYSRSVMRNARSCEHSASQNDGAVVIAVVIVVVVAVGFESGVGAENRPLL